MKMPPMNAENKTFLQTVFPLLNTEAVKFMAVGAVNTLFGTAVMFLCYNAAGMNYWFSSAMNYILGSILSFFLNKYFTFSHKGHTLAAALKFTVSISICYLLAYAPVKFVIRELMADFSPDIQENAALGAGAVIFVVLNFLMQKFFVFRTKK